MQCEIQMDPVIFSIHQTGKLPGHDKPENNKEWLSSHFYKGNEIESEPESDEFWRFHWRYGVHSQPDSRFYERR